jgi:hypothetical protein
MKEKLKEKFRFLHLSNLWHLNYNGIHIYLDPDEYKKATEEVIINIIKERTTQKPKPQPQKDILSHDEGLEEFRKTKEMLKRMKFSDFYKNQANN